MYNQKFYEKIFEKNYTKTLQTKKIIYLFNCKTKNLFNF